MTTGRLLILLAGALAASAAPASASEALAAKTFPAASVKTISVQTDGGPITLNVAEDKIVTAEVSPAAAPGDDCEITRALSGGTLTLIARSASRGILGAEKPCSAGFTVSAPARAAIKARSGSGDVEFGAFSGRTDVRTGSGAIRLHGASGPLTLRSGSGSVTGKAGGQDVDVRTGSGGVDLRGLTGSATARSGSGSIALAWTQAPQAGAIDAGTGSGDIAATLPADARLKISMKSGSGSTSSDFSSDPSAPLAVSLRSGSGSETLKKAPVKPVKIEDSPR